MGWSSILDGTFADTARSAICEIATAIAAQPNETSAVDRTLFFAYSSAVVDRPEAYDAAIEDLVRSVEAGTPGPMLFGGLAGVGWALAHVVDDAEGTLAPIDAALLQIVDGEAWAGHFDLISGLTGIGLYFVERAAANPDVARAGLERIVRHLERLAVRTADGATWFSPPALLPPPHRKQFPAGYYDCGVAHGVPGTIAFLARAAVQVPIAAPLAAEATRWLRAQRQPGGFPIQVAEGHPVELARTAWCYGDAGIAAALWSAAQRLGTDSSFAQELARDVARRTDLAACRVVDPGLCHGAIGLAHLCNRFFHASGDSAFRDAARRWYGLGLAMRVPEGVAGIAMAVGTGAEPSWNLVEGAIGVGLALTAAVTDNEPNWDRMLLTDVPVA